MKDLIHQILDLCMKSKRHIKFEYSRQYKRIEVLQFKYGHITWSKGIYLDHKGSKKEMLNLITKLKELK